MERLQLDQAALDYIEERRAHYLAEAANGEDDSLDPKDRRDREHVLGPLCRVKRDDDVLHNGDVYRVIGPARGEGSVYLLVQGMRGLTDAPFDGQYITDRAPADPEEDPLPIFIEETPEPEPEPEP